MFVEHRNAAPDPFTRGRDVDGLSTGVNGVTDENSMPCLVSELSHPRFIDVHEFGHSKTLR